MAWAGKYTKDPQAVLDYPYDWAAVAAEDEFGNPIKPWLETGDIIVSATATVSTFDDDPRPLFIENDPLDFTDTTTTVWLSGGTVGKSYLVTIHVSTFDGREDDRTILILIKEK